MVDLPGFDLNLRSGNFNLSDPNVSIEIETGTSRTPLEVALAAPVAGAALHLGLDRLLYSTSPIDRLLHSPDPLARFRAGNLPADPSPMMTRGMTARVGDIHAEIATRHDIGGMRPTDATLSNNVRIGGDDLLTARAAIGSDTRGTGAVRDPAATAALPQRIDGAAGATTGERGLRANAAIGIAPAAANGAVAGAALDVSFHGLVDVLNRTGAPIGSARDAPIGAILLYVRSDGSTVVELRTAAGFAGSTGTSATPLTGAAPGRTGEGYTLTGVFVQGDSAPTIAEALRMTPGPPSIAATPNAAVSTATGPGGSATVGPMVWATGAATLAGGVAAATPAVGEAAAAPNMQAGETAANAVPPPDGSTIPAGNATAPGDASPSFGDATPNADASDRPYIHAIWYDILALRFEALGVTLLERSTALRDVVWATAMEHGPFAAADESDVLSRVAADLDLTRADDATIVGALFAERGRVDADGSLAHYPEVLPFDQPRVSDRLIAEAELAVLRIVGA